MSTNVEHADAEDLKTLITHRNAMLDVLKTGSIDTERFQKESDEVIQDFALSCVQSKSDDMTT
ncbi:MAG TPA: hypothetical protein VGG14_16565 [Candidatus Sulfotelmatobacter sp.]